MFKAGKYFQHDVGNIYQFERLLFLPNSNEMAPWTFNFYIDYKGQEYYEKHLKKTKDHPIDYHCYDFLEN